MNHLKTTTARIILGLLFILPISQAWATFSIVAVDTVTREVGVAAASCVAGGGISEICHVEPNIGVFIAQAYFSYANLNKGKQLMREEESAQTIITELTDSDAQASRRQYGVITFTGGTECAAYSGTNIDGWYGHIIGKNYTIQGNTLSGENIIKDMENGFLNTKGPLAIKLMAALQAAKRKRADKRCSKTSSLCACIKVASPEDTITDMLVRLEVYDVEGDPIDALQEEFNKIYPYSAVTHQQRSLPSEFKLLQNYPNPFNPSTTIGFELKRACRARLRIINLHGQIVRTLTEGERPAGRHTIRWNGRNHHGEPVGSGVYLYQLLVEGQLVESKKLMLLH